MMRRSEFPARKPVMTEPIRHLVLLIVLGWILTPSYGADYYISPSGNDSHPGTRDRPFRTIQKAADVMMAGDRCLIQGGDYFETVKPAANGRSNAPIVFQADPAEQATLWGTRVVDAWEPVGDGVWTAAMDWDLGKNNQVFIDGKMIPEARWPNSQDDDPLTPEGAVITKGDGSFIQCDQIPEGISAEAWNGATLWVLAGAKWTSWSTIVDRFDPAAKTLHFKINDQGSVARYMNPSDPRGGVFYVSGTRGLLDAPYEWYCDGSSRKLYLCLPDGVDPNQLHVTAKCRQLAFDLSGRSFVHLRGLRIVGASISATECDHCLIQGVRVHYVSHTRGGRTGYGLNEATGIRLSGHDNVIRDSEIAYSAGNGIEVGGWRNAVINCWIHDIGYMGSYECPVRTSGWEHLISHNTIHDAGRDCMQPRGQAILIQYNDISRMGRICHDLGATYVVSSDGGGTEFRYNWSHDNLAEGTRLGIYLDNFTSNYLLHHNVCWNTRGDEIRLNKPSLYNLVAHNTMLGYTGNWGRWKTDWMYGCIYANNLLSQDIRPHPQPALVKNVENVPAGDLNAGNFQSSRAGLDRGVVVPGVTGSYTGERPDAGAYEADRPSWKPGHDFEHPPQPVYRLSDTPLRNRIQHGSFDWEKYRGQLGPWEKTGAETARVIRGRGGISESYVTRDTIIGAGVCLPGELDGIKQTVDGLLANTEYDLAGWFKTKGAATISLSVRDADEKETFASTSGQEWTQVHVRFKSGSRDLPFTVLVEKRGPGEAFVDDIGLVPVLDGFPMGQPGMCPLPD